MSKEVKWLGSTKCDFCKLDVGDYLIDGCTYQGPWAVMCIKCFGIYGVSASLKRFGTGLGQLYKRNSKNEYIKIDG